MKNIAFIINPISGTQQNTKRKLPNIIEKELDHTQWIPHIAYTECAGHAKEMAHQFVTMGFDAVVAVGGDGTVNEVAQGLRDSQTALGILPLGSGNGFARHLHIPMTALRAIRMLNHSEVISCDYGLANDRVFVTTCGVGFDALIASQFAGTGKRGFKTYIEHTIKDVFNYKPETYRIIGNNIDIAHKAFLITFANANQWGNDAYIAPKASIQDGQMDICMMSSSAILGAPGLALRLFTKSIDNSLFMDTIKAKEITLYRESEAPFHMDGEPVHMPKDIHIKMVENGMRVLVEKRF